MFFSQGVWLYYLMQLQYFSLDIPFITQPATTVTITNPYIDCADYCLLIYRSGSGGCTVRGVAVFKQLRPPKAPFAWGGESRALIGPHPSFAPTQALQHWFNTTHSTRNLFIYFGNNIIGETAAIFVSARSLFPDANIRG